MTVISDTEVPLFKESPGVPPLTSTRVKLDQGLGLGFRALASESVRNFIGMSREHPNTNDPCSSIYGPPKWTPSIYTH